MIQSFMSSPHWRTADTPEVGEMANSSDQHHPQHGYNLMSRSQPETSEEDISIINRLVDLNSVVSLFNNALSVTRSHKVTYRYPLLTFLVRKDLQICTNNKIMYFMHVQDFCGKKCTQKWTQGREVQNRQRPILRKLWPPKTPVLSRKRCRCL